jgi:heat shock protein HtpX
MNAFATGRSKDKTAVTVTSGLLQNLNRDEHQGVVAHEISHIKNRDVMLKSLAGVLLGRSLSWQGTAPGS